jgi:hypothetical protein
LKDQVSKWEFKYLDCHKEIGGLKDEIHHWKTKSEKHKTKYKTIKIEITSTTTNTITYEK